MSILTLVIILRGVRTGICQTRIKNVFVEVFNRIITRKIYSSDIQVEVFFLENTSCNLVYISLLLEYA